MIVPRHPVEVRNQKGHDPNLTMTLMRILSSTDSESAQSQSPFKLMAIGQ